MGSQALVVAEWTRARQPSGKLPRRVLRSDLSSGLNAGREKEGKRSSKTAEAAIRRRFATERLRPPARRLTVQPADLLAPQPISLGLAALVVDDLPIYRHAMRRILQPVADRVLVADDGLEALEQLRRSRVGGDPIDIVLTDMHMPVMDGLELISRMRSGGDLTPVVVLTTDPSEELRRTVERFTNTAVAIKPVDAARLMEMIQQMRSGREPQV